MSEGPHFEQPAVSKQPRRIGLLTFLMLVLMTTALMVIGLDDALVRQERDRTVAELQKQKSADAELVKADAELKSADEHLRNSASNCREALDSASFIMSIADEAIQGCAKKLTPAQLAQWQRENRHKRFILPPDSGIEIGNSVHTADPQ